MNPTQPKITIEDWVRQLKSDLESSDNNLLSYYKENIYGTSVMSALLDDMLSYFPDNYIHSEKTEADGSMLIEYVFSHMMENPNKKEEYVAKMEEQRKNFKKNWWGFVRQEYETPEKTNKKYIEDEWDNIQSLQILNVVEKKWTDYKLFRDDRFVRTKEWFKDKDNYLYEYHYFPNLLAKTRAKAFENDISLAINKLITHNYYNNIADGLLTRTPSVMIENPVVGYRTKNKAPEELEYDVDEQGRLNIIEVIEDSPFSQISSVLASVNLENVNISTKNKEAIRKTLAEKGFIETNLRQLDAKDLSLLTVVYSSMSADVLVNDMLSVSLKDIVESYAHKIGLQGKINRKTLYQDVFIKLSKLAAYKINITKKDKSGGQVLEHGTYSLFDMHSILPADSEDENLLPLNQDLSQKYVTTEDGSITLESESGGQLDPELLSTRNLGAAVIQIIPSFFMRESYRNNTNRILATNLYNKITNPQTQTLMFVLQGERLKARPNLESDISYATFKQHMRFDMKNNKVKSEIDKHFSYLKDEGVLIDNYTCGRTYVSIQWKPLSDEEKRLYNLS